MIIDGRVSDVTEDALFLSVMARLVTGTKQCARPLPQSTPAPAR
jgi:hypothetical protein